MLYTVTWPRRQGELFNRQSRFATWGGRVTDATPRLQWLVGKRVESAIEALRAYEADVQLVNGSWCVSTVEAAIKT